MIKMPYKTALRKKGVRESPFAHFIKLCWFEVHFKDVNNRISRREFCINFQKHVVDTGIIENIENEYGLCWNFYNADGTIKTPNYDNDLYCNEWIKKYEWDEQYPIFKSDKLMSTEVTEREKYIRNMAKLNSNDYDLLDTCYSKEEEYKSKEADGKDMTYYRNKNNETISNTDERLRKRNGFDKTKLELDGNLKADVNAEVKKPISPEDKLKNIMDLKERLEEQGL